MFMALSVQNADRSKQAIMIKPLGWVQAMIYWFWWHTKAYSVILGIVILVVLSLVVLRLQSLNEARKFQARRSNVIEEL
jgi:hypothetical protein